MAKIWIFGTNGDGQGSTAVDGTTSEANILPVIKDSDSLNVNINATDSATMRLSKKDLPSNWKEFLKIGVTQVSMVETTKAYNAQGAVLHRGFINKINANINDAIEIQVPGTGEYTAALAVNNLFDQQQTNPNAAVTFTGGDYRQLISNVHSNAFTKSGVPDGNHTPQISGTVDTGAAGSVCTYKSLLTSFDTYRKVLDDIRDNTSLNGNEYRFIPRWASAAKNRIVEDFRIGTDTSNMSAHINESTVIPISLNNADALSLSSQFGITLDATKIATRWIGQSKYGDTGANAGADITTKTNLSSGMPRFDRFFNPGVELTSAQMTEQLQSRLNQSSVYAAAVYTVQGDTKGDWVSRVGATLVFTGEVGTETEGFSVTVRVVGVTLSASNDTVKVDVMIPQPRYPALPRQKKPDEGKPIIASQPPNTPGGTQSTNPTRPPTSELASGWNSTGSGGSGRLGNNSESDRVNYGNVYHGELPAGQEFADIATGNTHVIARTSAGVVYGWGRNTEKQLGLDASIIADKILVPYLAEQWDTPIKQITAAANSSWGVTNDGSKVVAFGTFSTYGWATPPAVVNQIEGVDLGCFAVLADGTMWYVGAATASVVGAGVGAVTASTVWRQCKQTNNTTNMTGVSKVWSNTRMTIVLKTDGSLWYCSAQFQYFKPFTGTGAALPSGIVEVSVTAPTSPFSSTNSQIWMFARTSAGNVFFTGMAGVTSDAWTAATPYMTGNTWKRIFSNSVAQGGQGIAARADVHGFIDSDDVLWVMGKNTQGQLGLGDTVDRDTLTKYVTSSKVSKVALSALSSYALKY